jgi:hypothetical protein
MSTVQNILGRWSAEYLTAFTNWRANHNCKFDQMSDSELHVLAREDDDMRLAIQRWRSAQLTREESEPPAAAPRRAPGQKLVTLVRLTEVVEDAAKATNHTLTTALAAVEARLREDTRRALDARDDKIAKLEQDIATLKAKVPRFEGTYDGSRRYLPGALVRHAGSLWMCKTPSAGGAFSHLHFELVVKRGEAE